MGGAAGGQLAVVPGQPRLHTRLLQQRGQARRPAGAAERQRGPGRAGGLLRVHRPVAELGRVRGPGVPVRVAGRLSDQISTPELSVGIAISSSARAALSAVRTKPGDCPTSARGRRGCAARAGRWPSANHASDRGRPGPRGCRRRSTCRPGRWRRSATVVAGELGVHHGPGWQTRARRSGPGTRSIRGRGAPPSAGGLDAVAVDGHHGDAQAPGHLVQRTALGEINGAHGRPVPDGRSSPDASSVRGEPVAFGHRIAAAAHHPDPGRHLLGRRRTFDERWLLERKLDGVRCIGRRARREVQLTSAPATPTTPPSPRCEPRWPEPSRTTWWWTARSWPSTATGPASPSSSLGSAPTGRSVGPRRWCSTSSTCCGSPGTTCGRSRSWSGRPRSWRWWPSTRWCSPRATSRGTARWT